ncbi:transposase [Agrobacterium fabrum str. C58]|uniref:Transposase n=1 Tax=Agrobacterium fabrum (strain C58 / ATCC 33970) TaxID=176299 RepID=Q8U744_AGRFC|nr:transposase [Agrobacterium fabrum str. C58]
MATALSPRGGRIHYIGIRPARARMFGVTSTFFMALPAIFDGLVERSSQASPICLITLELNCYSVPASFANHESACGSILSGWPLQRRRNIL